MLTPVAPHTLPAWTERFELFGWLHGVTVAVCVGLIVGGCALGRWLSPAAERAARRGLAACSLAIFGVYVGYWAMPARFEWAYSLPLHVCDLMAFVAVWAMWSERRGPRGVLYFAGLALCTQGFITPIVTSGPAYLHFWLFWWLHLWIVGAAAYDLFARRFRPTWAEWRLTVGVGILYVLAMMALNHVIEANYGYVGATTPRTATLIDALGPWPWRVGILGLMTIALMALLMLPWTIRPRRERPGTA
jgi:hypothetical integral membrane protein (TIGR02206 family)